MASHTLKPSAGLLTRAFRKAAAGLTLVATAGCSASAPQQPVKAAPSICQNDSELSFIFENRRQPTLMGQHTRAMFYEDRSSFMQSWRSMLARHEMLMNIPENRESFDKWLKGFDHLKDAGISEKAEAVHEAIKKVVYYEDDNIVFGTNEYWASPIEILTPNENGFREDDCDGFRALEYFTLRGLGVPAENIYIGITNTDTENEYHAVLIVDQREEARAAEEERRAAVPAPPPGSGPAVPQRAVGHTPKEERVFSNTGGRRVPEKKTAATPPATPSSPIPPPRQQAEPPKKKTANPYGVLYYAFNENGAWYVPENTIPKWGKPKKKLSACVPTINIEAAGTKNFIGFQIRPTG